MRWLAWLSLALYVGVAAAEVYSSRELTFECPTPTGPVDSYIWELGDKTLVLTSTNRVSFVPKDRTIERVRCRGVDAEGNQGAWSEASKAYRIYALPADSSKDGFVGADDFGILSMTYGNTGWEVVE